MQRRAWRKWLTAADPRRLVFLDETGAKTNMTRCFARARKGQCAVDYAPHGHWNTTTLVAGISWDAVIAPMVLDGPMNSAAFTAYVEQMLIPALPKCSMVVMDNLSAHKSPPIVELIGASGSELRYLPSYSPDYNPIELMWSKVKTILRSRQPRTQEALYEAIAAALRQITPSDIRGYFFHCGVCIKN